MTGLSRRRSRVRVPSLPLNNPCNLAYCVASIDTDPAASGSKRSDSPEWVFGAPRPTASQPGLSHVARQSTCGTGRRRGGTSGDPGSTPTGGHANGDPGGRRSCRSFRGARKAQQTPALARYAHDVHPLWDDQGPATARLLPLLRRECPQRARGRPEEPWRVPLVLGGVRRLAAPPRPPLEVRERGPKLLEAREAVSAREEVDVGESRLHAACERLVGGILLQRVEPDDAVGEA